MSIENEPWYPFTPALTPAEQRLRQEWELVKPRIVEKIVVCSQAVTMAQEAEDRPRGVAIELDAIGAAWTGESAVAVQSVLAARSLEGSTYLSSIVSWAADAGDMYWGLYRQAFDEIARIDGLAPPREEQRAAHETAKAEAARQAAEAADRAAQERNARAWKEDARRNAGMNPANRRRSSYVPPSYGHFSSSNSWPR